MFHQALRSSAVLAIVAGATTHLFASLLMTLGVPFVSANRVLQADRSLLLLLCVGAAGVVAVAGLGVWRLTPSRSVEGLDWLGRRLSPLVLLPIAYALAHRDFGDETAEAMVLACFVIAFEALLRVSFGAGSAAPHSRSLWHVLKDLALKGVQWLEEHPRAALGIVLALTAAQALYMSLFAVWSHQRFQTYGYDLGQYDSIFANTLGGHPLRIPALGYDSDWGELVNNHADLGVFYMLPFYALHPRASMLLVMQAVTIAFGAVPVFLFARNRLSVGWSMVLAICWLGYPPLHQCQLYDVHMQPFGMVFTMSALAALDRKKWVLYWGFFTLAILCREDVSIGLTFLGTFLVLSGARVKTGIATIVIAVSFFLVLRFGIMQNTGFSEVFKELFPAGERGFGAIFKTLLSNPGYVAKSLMTWEKLRYVCQMFAPLAFLQLRRPAMWIVLIPGFMLTLLSTAYLPTIQTSFQYVSNWTAYGFAIIALVLASYRQLTDGGVRLKAAGFAMVAGIGLGNLQAGAWQPRPVVRGGFVEVPLLPPSPQDLQRDKDIQAAMEKIPRDAKLCTTDRVQPHVTWHLLTYSLKDGLFDCEYLLWANIPGDPGTDRAMTAMASGQYVFVESVGMASIAKRKPANAQ